MLSKDIVEMIFKATVFEDMLFVEYQTREKIEFNDKHKSHILAFCISETESRFTSGLCP